MLSGAIIAFSVDGKMLQAAADLAMLLHECIRRQNTSQFLFQVPGKSVSEHSVEDIQSELLTITTIILLLPLLFLNPKP